MRAQFVHDLVAAHKTEHCETAAYGDLTVLADRLGEEEVGDMLHQTLEEEETALERLASLTEDFDYESAMESQTAD